MLRIDDPKTFQELALADRAQGLTTALVPTMGYFHEGHLSLMRWARDNADRVYVSLFVNPTQFGPNEDLDAYPRNEERDAKLAAEAGVDVLFAPMRDAVYAPDHATWVQVPDLSEHLCGASRPVHFKGVATVVNILLNLAQPTVAVFGQKDWQQLALIRRMVRDLHIPTRIEGRPIMRETDGLALSSRNVYLSEAERAQAPGLQKGLQYLQTLVAGGEKDAATLKDALRSFYAEHVPAGIVDYVELVDPEAIRPVDRVSGPTLAAVAVELGKARLIDNLLLTPED